jgi:hypothetical protein
MTDIKKSCHYCEKMFLLLLLLILYNYVRIIKIAAIIYYPNCYSILQILFLSQSRT